MLERKVEAFLKKKQFKIRNTSILVGVSGGPDSLALLHFLWGRQEKWNIKIFAAHVDHMFRGDESYQEALFVQEFCESRGIPFEWDRINVPEFILRTGVSSQIAARECRYQFFESVLQKHGLNYLALGHHGDDQVETILMRLTRGSTGKARGGIPFTRGFNDGQIFRPFLCLTKDEIEHYCERYELNPRRDMSNEKTVYSRNRFRKVVLPFLKEENPQVHEQFQRFSEELEDDEKFLQELTEEKMNNVIKEKSDQKVKIDIDPFRRMPLPLQRRGIKLILNYLYKEKSSSLSAIHIDQIFSLFNNPQPSSRLDFPNGLKVERSYMECVFQFVLTEPQLNTYELLLQEPGVIELPNGDLVRMEYTYDKNEYTNKNMFLLPFKEDILPITIRTRRQGDRMTVKGMKGTKKLKDIFINEKVPKGERNQWPIITASNGQILWVPGLKKSDVSMWTKSNIHRYILLKYISKDLLGGTNHS